MSKTTMKSFDEVKADTHLFLLPTLLPFAYNLLRDRKELFYAKKPCIRKESIKTESCECLR
jgi:hypothetical protein